MLPYQFELWTKRQSVSRTTVLSLTHDTRKLPVEAYCDSFVISFVVGLLKVTVLKAIGVIRL